MSDTEKVHAVEKIGKEAKARAAGKVDKEHFDALMAKGVEGEGVAALSKGAVEAPKAQNLLDEVRDLSQRTDYVIHSSPSELALKVDDVVAQIDSIKQTLETPNLQLKSSVREILKNKLAHIDENLKVALDKAGIEYIPPQKPTGTSTPIDRFLGLLTHGQHQLETLGKDVQALSIGQKEITPANMLLIQIKVSYIQQEIELFTAMLNKALESTKTLLNVQV